MAPWSTSQGETSGSKFLDYTPIASSSTTDILKVLRDQPDIVYITDSIITMVNSLTQDRIVNKYSTGSLLPAFLLILGFIVVSGLLHTVESRRTHHHYSDESDSNQHSRTGLSNAQDIQNANKIETEQQCKVGLVILSLLVNTQLNCRIGDKSRKL